VTSRRPTAARDTFPGPMFAANVALEMTLGLAGVFFVALPLLVNVLIGFIAVQVYGERQDNLDFERQHPNP
jgi:hypothetical protein